MEKYFTRILLLFTLILSSVSTVWAADTEYTFTGYTDLNDVKVAYTNLRVSEGASYDTGSGIKLPDEGSISIPVTEGQSIYIWATATDAVSYKVINTDNNYENKDTLFASSADTRIKKDYPLEGKVFRIKQTGYVVFKNTTGENRSCYVSQLKLTDEYYLEFGVHEKTYDILDMNFTEPVMSYHAPGGATINYSFSNSSIATAGALKSGSTIERDIQFYEGGVVTITAALANEDGDVYIDNETQEPLYSDSYVVTVKCGDAAYEITTHNNYGTVCTLTTAGKLSERMVNIPGMTMEFGSVGDNVSVYNSGTSTWEDATNLNITLVKIDTGNNGSQLVAQTLANDGWRDFVCKNGDADNKDIPTQGTFFTFKPTVDGTLYLTGDNYTNTPSTYNTVLVEFNADGTFSKLVSTIDEASFSNKDFSVTAGKIYYLYGKNANCYNVSSNLWTVCQLRSFAFKSNFRFNVEAARITKSDLKSQGYTQSATGSADYSIWNGTSWDSTGGSGGLNVTIDNSGKITYNNGDGGAVIVKASSKSTNEEAFYVLTVPYTTHKWLFNNDKEANITMENLQSKTTNWGVTYKNRGMTTDGTNMLYSINKAVLCNNAPLTENNALYIENTAGLLISGPAKNCGLNVTEKDNPTPAQAIDIADNENYVSKEDNPAEYTIALNQALRKMLNYKANDVKDPNLLTFSFRNTLTIPDVPEGYYIRIHMKRHGDTAGRKLRFTSTNVRGLDGKNSSGTTNAEELPFEITGTSEREGETNEGNYIFKVATAGDVVLKVDDSGWVDIYDIEVMAPNTFESDLKFYKDVKVELNLSNSTIAYKAATSITNNTMKLETNWERIDAVRGATLKTLSNESSTLQFITFRIGEKDTSVDAEIDATDRDILKINGGTGTVQVIEEVTDLTGKVIIDRAEKWFAVGKMDVQTYPHTWDFTARNMNASADGANFRKLSNVGSAGSYAQWTNNQLVMATTTTDGIGNTIDKPLFAQGSQLTIGTTQNDTINETAGLGVALMNVTQEMAGVKFTIYDANTTESGLYFPTAGTLTVPDVEWGDNASNPTCIFVQADKPVTASWNGTTVSHNSEKATMFDLKNDIYVFPVPNTGTTSDFTINIPADTRVAKVAVSNQVKTITNDKGKLTESRSIAIDYQQTREFSNNHVHAYVIPDTSPDYFDYKNKDYSVLTVKEVDCIAGNNGLLLFNKDAEGNNKGKPDSGTAKMALFSPAANITPEDYHETSPLKANVSNATWPASNNDTWYFVFTDTYKSIFTGDTEYKYDEFCFSKVYTSGTQAAKTAVLQLQASLFNDAPVGAKSLILLHFPDVIDDELANPSETTGIDGATLNDTREMANDDNWYDLSGRKVPNTHRSTLPKGIYIHNGKKIVIR